MNISPAPSLEIVSPPPSIPPPPKPSNKFLIILGGLAILVVFITGGLFLGKTIYAPKSLVTIQPTIALFQLLLLL